MTTNVIIHAYPAAPNLSVGVRITNLDNPQADRTAILEPGSTYTFYISGREQITVEEGPIEVITAPKVADASA